jgi:tetratricopeptide (TPR) repeat protein
VCTLKIMFVITLMVAAGSGSSNFSTAAYAADADRGSLSLHHQSSFSRLSISLDNGFKPVVQERAGGFEIQIPSATLMDIGVAFGGEAEFNRYLSKVKDSRLAKIEIKEKENALVISGKYVFPTGKDAFARPAMEHFDFHQSEQGKYIVDFWYKKGPTLAEAEKARKLQEAKSLQKQKEEIIKKDAEKKALREKRIEESKRSLMFCESPLDRENTLWVKYRAEHPVLNFNSYFPEFIPDHGFNYKEPRGKSEEEQMIRLALKLSKDNKHALVVKTVDFLEREYPKSKFLLEMQFLKASSYYRLELYDQGRALIQELAKKARGSEIGMQTTAFLAVQSFRKEEWLSALDSFFKIQKDMPNHPLIWLFRYGAAECLYQIRQYDQARIEYEWLQKNAPKAQIKVEAGFKLGDLYFNRNQYAQAIQAYSSVIQKNSEGLPQYPHVFLNLAEALFQLEEYGKAEENLKKYLEMARTQPTAWKASLRLAEIRSINNPKDSEKNFTETVNQYPMTPGAVIARLRMIPCGNHGGFDLTSSIRYIGSNEVKNIEDPSSFYSTSLKELVALTEVRTLLSFEQDEKAIQRGLQQLRENPSLEARKMIENGMVGGVKRILQKNLDQKNYYGAIAIYEKYGDYLPPPTFDPLGDEMRLKIAQFAADKKLTTLALKLIEPYRSGDEIELKSAANEIQKTLQLESGNEQEDRAFVEAKSLWNGEKFDPKDEKQSAVFLDKLSSIRDQSKFVFERDLMKSLYLKMSGSDEKALDIGKSLLMNPVKTGNYSKAQTWAYVAELARKLNENSYSAKAFREARLLAQKLTEKDTPTFDYRHFPNVPSLSYLYTSEGEQLELQQKWKEAVALYGEAIENKIGGNHVLYAHARALLKDGGRESKLTASRSLEKIKLSQDDDVWKNLAQKALDGIAKEGKDDVEKRK